MSALPILTDNNLDKTDPLFVNAATNDLHLSAGSPVIDNGDKTVPGLPSTDRDGTARVVGANVDIGAYEYHYGLCGDADGNSVVNIVDALAVARNVVGLPPPPLVDVVLADVNENGNVDINDALFIARYEVGLLLPPEACVIGEEL